MENYIPDSIEEVMIAALTLLVGAVWYFAKMYLNRTLARLDSIDQKLEKIDDNISDVEKKVAVNEAKDTDIERRITKLEES